MAVPTNSTCGAKIRRVEFYSRMKRIWSTTGNPYPSSFKPIKPCTNPDLPVTLFTLSLLPFSRFPFLILLCPNDQSFPSHRLSSVFKCINVTVSSSRIDCGRKALGKSRLPIVKNPPTRINIFLSTALVDCLLLYEFWSAGYVELVFLVFPAKNRQRGRDVCRCSERDQGPRMVVQPHNVMP